MSAIKDKISHMSFRNEKEMDSNDRKYFSDGETSSRSLKDKLASKIPGRSSSKDKDPHQQYMQQMQQGERPGSSRSLKEKLASKIPGRSSSKDKDPHQQYMQQQQYQMQQQQQYQQLYDNGRRGGNSNAADNYLNGY